MTRKTILFRKHLLTINKNNFSNSMYPAGINKTLMMLIIKKEL